MYSKGPKLLPCLTPLVGAALYALAVISPASDGEYLRGGTYICLLVYLALATAVTAYLLCRFPVAPTPISPKIKGCIGLLCGVGFWILGLQALLISQSEEGRVALFALLCAFCALFGGLSPALEGFGVRTEPCALCGMCGAISLISYVMYLYFDTTAPKNSTYKLLLSFALLMGVLYLLSRIRYDLGKKTVPAVATTVQVLASTVAGSLGIGSIVVVLLPGHRVPLGQFPTCFLALFFLLIIKDILFKLQPQDKGTKMTDDEVCCE